MVHVIRARHALDSFDRAILDILQRDNTFYKASNAGWGSELQLSQLSPAESAVVAKRIAETAK